MVCVTHAKTKRKVHFQKRGGVYKFEVLMAPGGWVPPRQSAKADSSGGKGQSATADKPKSGKPPAGFTRQGHP